MEENKWLQDFLSVCVGEETLKDVQMFLDDIQHTLSTSLLDGGISVRALSRLPCDRWLSEDLIAHCFNKLNKLASEDEFIVFSEDLMVDTVKFRNSLSQMLASEKSKKCFHFAINTRKDGSGRNLITSSGIHWAYLCCDLSQNDCVYGDSLAYPLPSNIALLLDPLKAELRNICKGTNKPLNLNPRILHDHGNYEPFCRCRTLFPLQTCGTICGTIPIIISALCVDKFQLWQQLLNQSPITENNRKRLSFITRPSQHAEVIRASIISWIVRDEFRASMLLCDNNEGSYVRTSSKVGGRSVDHRKRYHASDEDFPPFPTKTAKVESGYKQETLSKSVPSMGDPKSANTPLSLNETVLATPAIKSVMKDAKIENSWKHETLSENGPVTQDPKSGDIPLDFSEFFVASPASKPVEKDAMTFEFSPLPYLSRGWYYQRGRVVASNEARDALRQSQPAASDDKEKLISLRRGEKTGSLADNLTEIHCKMRKSHPARKTQQLIAVKAVGEHLLKHGPLIKTQDAIQIYREKALVGKETSEGNWYFFYMIHCSLDKWMTAHLAFYQKKKLGEQKTICHCFQDSSLLFLFSSNDFFLEFL